jgi:sugar O-acyltransferase (sialic acid O-acetyltransferase NeuD family)
MSELIVPRGRASSPRPVAVFGAGGFGREVAWLAEACGREVAYFLDDHPTAATLNDIPVTTLGELLAKRVEVEVAIGVGNPKAREAIARRIGEAKLPFAELIHPRTERSRWITWGPGVVICAGNILTTNITLGTQVQINLDCTLGHDVRLGDFATLAPGVHLSGWVFVGARAYVGTGAVVINGTADAPITIGDDAVIGAGACVTKSVPAGVTAVGVPARVK